MADEVDINRYLFTESLLEKSLGKNFLTRYSLIEEDTADDLNDLASCVLGAESNNYEIKVAKNGVRDNNKDFASIQLYDVFQKETVSGRHSNRHVGQFTSTMLRDSIGPHIWMWERWDKGQPPFSSVPCKERMRAWPVYNYKQ